MRHGQRNTLAAGLMALASHAVAQVTSVCPTTDVCFKLNIPASTASSGDGDVFFQLSAPSNYEYVALGQGTSMSGANMFIVYTDGSGNVTLSPRLGTGHTMPQFNSDAQVSLLEGSGVSNGKMVANVRCSSCNTWSGGSASFSGGNGNWIYATKAGGAKDSTSQSENIDEHDEHGAFQWSYANAKGGNSVNPLLAASGSGGSTGTSPTSCVPRPAGATGTATTVTNGATPSLTNSYGDDDDDDHSTHEETNSDMTEVVYKRQEINYCDQDSSSNGDITVISSGSNTRTMLIAHGTLAALAFVIFFPFGAIAIRLASFTGVVWFHAAFQAFGYIVYTAALGLGVYIAKESDKLTENHPIIGLVVFAVLFFQPLFGFLHHSYFKKQGTRTVWSHLHLWVGRLAITLGIINGGLGFLLAESSGNGSRAGSIAYGVIAGLVWVAWVAAIVIGERRRRSSSVVAGVSPKYPESQMEMNENHPENGHFAPK